MKDGIDKETTTIRIPTDIKEEMVKEAKEYGISLNSYLLMTSGIGRKALKLNPLLFQSIRECI